MNREEAKSKVMTIYGSLSEELKQANDVLVEGYDPSDEFKVGDVIKSKTAYVVLTYVCKSKWNGMLLKTCASGLAGHCYTCMEGFKGWEKTGRHFPQIAEMLKQMQEGKE